MFDLEKFEIFFLHKFSPKKYPHKYAGQFGAARIEKKESERQRRQR